jgi:hypothetical protein
MSNKKINYLKKTVNFDGKQLIMFSINGDTWSTRKEELHEIIERHELEKQNFGGQIKGGPQVKTKLGAEDATEIAEKNKSERKNIEDKPVQNLKAKEKDKKQPKKAEKQKISVKKIKGKLPEAKKRIGTANKASKPNKAKKKVA